MTNTQVIDLAKSYGLYSRVISDNETIRIYIPKKNKTHRWVDWNTESKTMTLFRDGFFDIMGYKQEPEEVILLAKSIKK